MKSAVKIAALLLVLLVGLAAGRMTSRAQDQPAGSEAKTDKEAKPAEKKKGGFFGGAKAVAGAGSQQQGLTATGGAKGVGEEGGAIGGVQPTAEHRAVVSAMEDYSIPEPDLKQFQADGKLIPAK